VSSRRRFGWESELTPPFRHARPIPPTRLLPVPRATRTPCTFGLWIVQGAFYGSPLVKLSNLNRPHSRSHATGVITEHGVAYRQNAKLDVAAFLQVRRLLVPPNPVRRLTGVGAAGSLPLPANWQGT
jgi:hypothetical protein